MYLISKKTVYVIVAVVVAVIVTAVICNAADLKCVTIKFKNDSELKLKTQWFINACDTTKNIVWVKHQYMDSAMVPYDLAEKDRQGLKYEWIWQERGLIRWQVIKTTVICRTLLFPPDVRREPKESGSVWGAPLRDVGMSDEQYRKVCDEYPPPGSPVIIPGEALLWYEERKLQ